MIIIRTIGWSDIKALIQLRCQAVEEFPQHFSSTAEEVTSGLEAIAARLCSQNNLYLGAFSESRLVGMVRFERDHGVKVEHQAEVASLFVVPGERRKGVGRALMLELVLQARQWG